MPPIRQTKRAADATLCDPCRIQTCNPHIRSVVLYSVELMDPGAAAAQKGFNTLSACFFEKETSLRWSAVRTRLELATYGVTGRYSNQLNYRTG